MKNYYELIKEEAKDFVEENEEELKEIIKENKDKEVDEIFDEAIYQKWDLHDKIHEWLDNAWYGFLRNDYFKQYNSELTTCSAIIDESNEVESDGGLWEGQEPQEAIKTQAFFTARNDLYFEVEEQIKDLINQVLLLHDRDLSN